VTQKFTRITVRPTESLTTAGESGSNKVQWRGSPGLGMTISDTRPIGLLVISIIAFNIVLRRSVKFKWGVNILSSHPVRQLLSSTCDDHTACVAVCVCVCVDRQSVHDTHNGRGGLVLRAVRVTMHGAHCDAEAAAAGCCERALTPNGSDQRLCPAMTHSTPSNCRTHDG